MGKLLGDCYPLIINSVSEINEVVAIGKSGGSKLPEYGESDIDIYVFCNRIPEINHAKKPLTNLATSFPMRITMNTAAGFGGQ